LTGSSCKHLELESRKSPTKGERDEITPNYVSEGRSTDSLLKTQNGQACGGDTSGRKLDLKVDWFPTADGLRSEMWH
jgi:hypothetical protein